MNCEYWIENRRHQASHYKHKIIFSNDNDSDVTDSTKWNKLKLMWIVNSCRAHTAHTLTFFDSILLLFNRKKTFFSDHSSQASTMVWWSLQAVYFASQLKVPCIFTTIHFKRTKKVHFKTIKMNVRRWKKAKTKTKITTQRISYRHWCASIGASFFLFNFMVSNF